MLAETVEAELAQWAHALTYDDIAPAVRAEAKRMVLDTIACGFAGTSAVGLERINEYLITRSAQGSASVWSRKGQSFSAADAAQLNALYSAALDFDTVHEQAKSLHPCIVVVPAVLALAEERRLSGKSVLVACVVGLELLTRLAQSVTKNPGWLLSSALGVTAAAAACAKAVDGDERLIGTSMGIAMSHAAGSLQTLIEKTQMKRLQTAFAAKNAVLSLELAEIGIDAPSSFLFGAAGFEKLYCHLRPETLTNGLGERYAFCRPSFKAYPSCYCTHGVIEAALELRRRVDATPESVKKIRIAVSPFVNRLTGGRYLPRGNIQVQGQFSLRYTFAASYLRGQFQLSEISERVALSEDIRRFTELIEVDVDDTLGEAYVPVVAAVLTANGSVEQVRVESMPGRSDSPMTDEVLNAKAADCFGHAVCPLSDRTTDSVIHAIRNLESLDVFALPLEEHVPTLSN